jgi:hypothetical protein
MLKKKQINKSEMEAFVERLKTRPEFYEQFSRILDLFDHSFASAAKKLLEHYGIELPVSSIRKYVESNARCIAVESSEHENSPNSLHAGELIKL